MDKSKSLVIIILMVFSVMCTIGAQTEMIDKVIAKVGSEYILLSEVEEEFIYAKSKDPKITDDVKCMILENIIAQKLIVYHAKLDSVDVSEEEVEAQLNYRFEAILKQMNGDEAFFQEYYGATITEMKERYRDDQYQKLLADRMQQKLISEVDITPSEVEKFYKSIPVDSLPYFKSEMEMSEIIYKPKVNAVERQKAFDLADSLRILILAGQLDFEKAAKKYSADPGSGSRGGDLGFAKRGDYVPEFEAAVFGLKPEEYSEIIETEFGFHFIQLIERRGNAVHARHILIKPEITTADLLGAQNLLDSIRTLIMLDSMSFEAGVRRYSIEELPSYANAGRVKNYNNNSSFFASDDLDPDTYFAIYNLKPGELSKVVDVTLPNGEKAYRLIRINSLSKPHRASMETDYDKISNYAKESKKSEYFVKWLDEKRKSTFIKVDHSFNHCSEVLKEVLP